MLYTSITIKTLLFEISGNLENNDLRSKRKLIIRGSCDGGAETDRLRIIIVILYNIKNCIRHQWGPSIRKFL